MFAAAYSAKVSSPVMHAGCLWHSPALIILDAWACTWLLIIIDRHALTFSCLVPRLLLMSFPTVAQLRPATEWDFAACTREAPGLKNSGASVQFRLCLLKSSDRELENSLWPSKSTSLNGWNKRLWIINRSFFTLDYFFSKCMSLTSTEWVRDLWGRRPTYYYRIKRTFMPE